MTDKALYILAGYDDDTERYLSGIQNALYEKGFCGLQTKGIPQHITLDSFSVEMEGELGALLKSLSQTIEPFSVTFNHVGIFGGSKVLFIAPDCNVELLSLKEQFGSSIGWTPHTTMLIDEPDVILRAIPCVLDELSGFTGQITSLHMYEFWPTRHVMSVNLGDFKRS